jgi:hypothetical protein
VIHRRSGDLISVELPLGLRRAIPIDRTDRRRENHGSVSPNPTERSARICGDDAMTAEPVASLLGTEQRDAVVRWLAQMIRRELRAVRDAGGTDADRG